MTVYFDKAFKMISVFLLAPPTEAQVTICLVSLSHDLKFIIFYLYENEAHRDIFYHFFITEKRNGHCMKLVFCIKASGLIL